MKGFIALLLPLFILLSSATGAASSPPPAVIQIGVYSNPLMGFLTHQVDRNQAATFGASIELPRGFLLDGDLYFGFLLPGNTQPHTWTLVDGAPVLAKGMHPLQEGIDLEHPPLLGTSAIAGGEIEHTFADTDPVGMYIVFALVVIEGTDPTDHRNWYAVGTSPLFVE